MRISAIVCHPDEVEAFVALLTDAHQRSEVEQAHGFVVRGYLVKNTQTIEDVFPSDQLPRGKAEIRELEVSE